MSENCLFSLCLVAPGTCGMPQLVGFNCDIHGEWDWGELGSRDCCNLLSACVGVWVWLSAGVVGSTFALACAAAPNIQQHTATYSNMLHAASSPFCSLQFSVSRCGVCNWAIYMRGEEKVSTKMKWNNTSLTGGAGEGIRPLTWALSPHKNKTIRRPLNELPQPHREGQSDGVRDEGEAIISPLADRFPQMQVGRWTPKVIWPAHTHRALRKDPFCLLRSVIKEAGEREERNFPQKENGQNKAPLRTEPVKRRMAQRLRGRLAYWPGLVHRWRPPSACRFRRRPNSRMAKMVKLSEPLPLCGCLWRNGLVPWVL